MLNRASPDRKSRRVTGILNAPLTGPGLDQRAIHREVLVRKIRLGLLLQHALEEFLRHLLVQQPIPAHRDCSARRSWCGCGTEYKRCSLQFDFPPVKPVRVGKCTDNPNTRYG